MVKSCGWGGNEQSAMWWVVAHVIIVSAQSKELGFGFFSLGLTLESGFGACWDRGLGTWTRA